MLNWLHERDPIRYDVYCTLIKVAGKAGLMDQISFSLDQVDICIGKCLLIFTCIGCKYICTCSYIVQCTCGYKNMLAEIFCLAKLVNSELHVTK